MRSKQLNGLCGLLLVLVVSFNASQAQTGSGIWRGFTWVAMPTLSPSGGSFSNLMIVTISCATSGATIRYTTDGSTPTSSSPVYIYPLFLSRTTTVKALAFKSGMLSSLVASATYTKVVAITATPTFRHLYVSGTGPAYVSVSISCATSDAEIRYTIDGSTPTDSSPVYSNALRFYSTTTLKAKAFKNGMMSSAVASQTYTPLVVTVRTPGDSYESDDSASSAKTISPGQTQNRSIHTAGNVDWVTFILTQRSEVRIETSGSTGDTQMWLYGPNSSTRQIEYDDDDGNGWFSLIDRAGANALDPGTYYIKIQEYANNGTIESYRLSLTVRQVQTGDSYERDDSASAAKTISSGQTQNRSIHAAGNVDWATFTLTQRSEVRIETSGSAGDTQMWLYGPNSSTRQIEYDDDDGNGWFSLISRTGSNALDPGTYYIKIQEYGNNGTIESYRLSLTVTPALQTKYVTLTQSRHPLLVRPQSVQSLFDAGSRLLLVDDDGSQGGGTNDDVSLDVRFTIRTASNATFPNQSSSGGFDFTNSRYCYITSDTAANQLRAATFAQVKQVGSGDGWTGWANPDNRTMLLTNDANANTSVHEWGHNCGLYHRGDSAAIMYYYRSSTKNEINSSERAAMLAY